MSRGFARNDYRGPDFNTIDEKLQNGFMDYLSGLGVNEELGIFIENYSLDKE